MRIKHTYNVDCKKDNFTMNFQITAYNKIQARITVFEKLDAENLVIDGMDININRIYKGR